MTHRSPVPEKVLPGHLLLRTGGRATSLQSTCSACSARNGNGSPRSCEGSAPMTGPARPGAPTGRRTMSSATCATATRSHAGTDGHALDLTAGFDPRITPRGWPAASASQSPGASFSRFLATTDGLLALLRERLAQGLRFDARLPYGPMDWTILALHAFWDSWLHERDVLLARGREHPTDGDATVYAAAYGLFIAAAVAAMFGGQVQEKLTLGGDGGGIFELDSRRRCHAHRHPGNHGGAACSRGHRRALPAHGLSPCPTVPPAGR